MDEDTKRQAAACYYAQRGICDMDGAAGTDADNVSAWTEKDFANPSQRINVASPVLQRDVVQFLNVSSSPT